MRLIVVVLVSLLYSQNVQARDALVLQPSTPLLGAAGDARGVSWLRGSGYVGLSLVAGAAAAVPVFLVATEVVGENFSGVVVGSLASTLVNAMVLQGVGWLVGVERTWGTSFVSSALGAVLGWGIGYAAAYSSEGFGKVTGFLSGVMLLSSLVSPILSLADPLGLSDPPEPVAGPPDVRPLAVSAAPSPITFTVPLVAGGF